MNNEKFRELADTHCDDLGNDSGYLCWTFNEPSLIEFATAYARDAAPTARDAGTIDTPKFRDLLNRLMQSSTWLRAVIDHVDQHVAAAVGAAERKVRAEYESKLNAFIEKGREEREDGLARINRAAAALELRSTAGVGEVTKPVIDVWIDPETMHRSLLDHGTPLSPSDPREFVGSLVWSTDPQDAPLNAENLKLRPDAATAPVSAERQAELCRLKLCTRAADHAQGCDTYDPARYPEARADSAPVSAAQGNLHELAAAIVDHEWTEDGWNCTFCGCRGPEHSGGLLSGHAPGAVPHAADCIVLKAKAIIAAPSAGAPVSGAGQAQDVCAEMRALCSACGGTGDVTTITGEWRGSCDCEASRPADGEELPAPQITQELFQAIAAHHRYIGLDWDNLQDRADVQEAWNAIHAALAMRQPQGEPRYTLDEIAHACMMAEVSDSRFEAVGIYLQAAAKQAGKEPS